LTRSVNLSCIHTLRKTESEWWAHTDLNREPKDYEGEPSQLANLGWSQATGMKAI
jgi:hypothetical protein